MKLHVNCVSKEMMDVLVRLMEMPELAPFRLVGGTALALQFGHRTSVDIDLFAGGHAETENLPAVLAHQFGRQFEVLSKNRNGFMGRVANVKVDVVDWKVPFTQEPLIADGIRMATAPDIFASKCDALLTRKAEKDFVDIAIIASRFSLAELFATLRKRYFYLTAGAVAALLLKKEAIERDLTIRYFDPYGFDYFAEQLRGQLAAYEAEIKEQKLSRENDHMQKIQSLIEQKRKKT